MRYLFHGICIQNQRPSNMDSLLLKQGSIAGRDALLALVCDGVGSMADGAFASGEAARMLGEWFDGAEAADRIGLDMRDAVLRINASIIARARLHKMQTATTFSALLLVEDAYRIVHIGDSRIYCLDSHGAGDTVQTQMTHGAGDTAQTMMPYGAGDPALTQMPRAHADSRSLTLLTHDDVSESGRLVACIGQTEDVFPQYAEGNAEGKTFLLCSDGLYKRLETGVMAARLGEWGGASLQAPVEDMVRYVIGQGEQDNISVALVKIGN